MHSLEVMSFPEYRDEHTAWAKPEFIGVAMKKKNKGCGWARIAFYAEFDSEEAFDWLWKCDHDWEKFVIGDDGHLRPYHNSATTEYFNLAMSAKTMAMVADLGCDSESHTTLVLVSAQKVAPRPFKDPAHFKSIGGVRVDDPEEDDPYDSDPHFDLQD